MTLGRSGTPDRSIRASRLDLRERLAQTGATPVARIDKTFGSAVADRSLRRIGEDRVRCAARRPHDCTLRDCMPGAHEVFKLVRGVQAAAQQGAGS